jgi:hypothetical protein
MSFIKNEKKNFLKKLESLKAAFFQQKEKNSENDLKKRIHSLKDT